jgi:hypothetical protein
MTFQTPPPVIPEAPSGAVGDAPPLTAVQMADKAWSHLQAAVAAGRLIEARGWMRLYKDLKPFARHEEIEAREARMEDVAPPLHCFSAPESHEPPPADDEPPAEPAADAAADPLPVKDLARLIAELKAVTARAEQTLADQTVRLPLHCFSRPESHHPGQGP